MITKDRYLDKTSLMDVLWDIQRKRRHIGKDDLDKIAQAFNMSKKEVEGVITFYHFFHRNDVGKYTIYVNNSIISKITNFDTVKKAFEEALGIGMGQVTDDKLFGLFETSCIGLSDQETAVLINFKPFTNLTREKVFQLVDNLRKGKSLDDLYNYPKDNIRYTPPLEKTVFFRPYIPGAGLKALKGKTPDELIDMVQQSKLAGRGGAFFPTGLKWQFCRNQKANQKYIICNADEGEPGTFKDRVLLNHHTGLVLEGMALAGYAVGATKGFIYLRAEYFYLIKKIEQTIKEFKANGLLGDSIMGLEGFDFDIHVHIGAGAYVCGEETALIASMEGRRGEPSTKEYFPVEKGFLGKPTIVNNVETLAAVPRILEMGLDNYLKIGTPKTRGTKLMSVSGDCKKPGIYEIEWGMKIRDFLNLIEAEDPNMILYNGFAGEVLSKADFDRELSGENLLADHIQFEFKDPQEYARKMGGVGLRSGGSFMVFSKARDLLEVLKNVSDFFVTESCGVCVPCRTGNFLLNKKLNKILLKHAEKEDLTEFQQWSSIIKQSSRCGLGKTSTNCLMTAILKFPDYFDACLSENSNINISFNLDKAVANYEEIINEIEENYG